MHETLPLNSIAMVIEDDEKLSDIFCKALKLAGYASYPVRTGQQAFRELAIFRPVLITLDLQLPDALGEDILRYIRSEPSVAKAWVIVATSEPAMASTLHEIADLVLVKPVSFNQLSGLAARFRRTRV